MRTPLMILPAALLCACAEAAPSLPESSVRDSAGIRIVELDGSVLAQLPLVEAGAPTLVIGVLEGEEAYTFGSVAGAHELPDGRIAVADGMAREIRIYDPRGRHLRSYGRKGGGPGEYEGIRWFGGGPGDSLYVYDPPNRRLTVLTPEGMQRMAEVRDGFWGLSQQAAVQRGGHLVLLGMREEPPEETAEWEGIARDTLLLVRYRAGVAVPDTLARLLGPETVRSVIRGDGQTMVLNATPAFGRTTQLGLGADHYLVADNGRYELHMYSLDGALLRITRVRIEPERATAAEMRAFLDTSLARAHPPLVPYLRPLLEESPGAEAKPLHGRVYLDDLERAWVAEPHHHREQPQRFTVFSADGRPLARVVLPLTLEIKQIGADFVLGVHRDEYEVPHVVRLPVRLSESGS